MPNLSTASREELVAIIAELYATVAALQARIAELEAERPGPGSPPKTPNNSSVPPSQGFKPNREERRRSTKRGPKRGHVGISHRRQDPDQIVRCRPATCRDCGAALSAAPHRRVGRRQVIELPEIRPVVIEAWLYAAVCPDCGTRTVGQAPVGLEATRTFGPRIEALLAYLHMGHHLSHERLVAVCGSVFGLRISEGAIASALTRLAARAAPEVDTIRAAVRASPVINSDETGVRVAGDNWWPWVFQTPTASYHTIVPSRGLQIPKDFLGEVVPDVWSSELLGSQLGVPAGVHQVCHSHQIRDLTYAVDADPQLAERLWARDLRHVFSRAIRLHRERAHLTAATFANRKTRVLLAAQRLVFGPLLCPGPARKLQVRYQHHWEALFVFLDRDDVEPTNNSSERDIRNAVIHDKITGGYRSAQGARQGAIFTTILATARKLGENLYQRLCTIAGPSPLQALVPAR